ncbi:MAG: RNA polymerase sigma factor RpoD/SigA [Deltaproteobacteria bacterium]
MENIKAYIKEVRKIPLLTAEQEVELSHKALKGNKKARDKMIRSNLRLVINIAKRYMHLGIPLMDLIEEGNVGLMKAVERFNPKKGFRFSTYGAWWIKQSITRSIFDQSRTVRIPVYVNELLSKYKKTNERLMGRLKRMPTDTEVAKAMKVAVDKITRIRGYIARNASLDSPINEEGGNEIIDLIEDKNSAAPDEQMDVVLVKERLTGVMSAVSEREQKILRLRFGVPNGKQHTLAEVAKKLRISRERVRQIEENTLKKLKKVLNDKDKEVLK